MRGSPIRKSSDQRSVDSSPRLIAASYVLHRLLVPRHPPCALNNLATQKPTTPPPEGSAAAGTYKNSANQSQKMLASTVQFSTYDQRPTALHRRTPRNAGGTTDRPALSRQRLPAPSGPNSVPTAGPPPATRVPRTPRCAVLAAAGDDRPNWSAFHPRAPPRQPAAPREPGNHLVLAWLWTDQHEAGRPGAP